ncbi:MAG TPA: tetratricopeptide repeat protein [Thermoanaerobaculia bacterium]|nr:tetratricopeptide repeat protein [Thermoanaerobaculia bacterium]
MTKDNLLFAAFGLLLGFIAAWLMFEKVSMSQPPRAVPGQTAVVPGGPAGMGGGTAAPPGAVMPGAEGNPPNMGGAPMARVQELQQRLEQNPQDADAALELANLNFDIERWERARDLYLQYLSLRPANPDILNDLGVSYREMGQFNEAIQTFRQAEEMVPGHWQSLFNQVVVLAFDLNQFDEAQRILEELRKVQPNNPDVERLSQAIAQQRNAA